MYKAKTSRRIISVGSVLLLALFLFGCANVTPPVTDPVTDSFTDPVTYPVTEPLTVPVTDPVTEPATDPVTVPVTDPATDPVTDPSMQYTYVDIVNRLLDTKALAVGYTGEKSAEFTSYHRNSKYVNGKYTGWDANGDGGQYISKTEDGGFLIAEMDGPGYISRIWSATASTGHVKIYVDGNEEPIVDLSFENYFTGRKAPFNYPGLCYSDSGQGKNCYVPITYNKSCKVVAYGDWGKYYHVNYTTLPEGASVESMPKTFSAEQKEALNKVSNFFRSNLSEHPEGLTDAPFESITVSKNAPYTKLITAPSANGGAINGILIKTESTDDPQLLPAIELLKKLNIKIYWDGSDIPFVNAPLGDFFGSAYGYCDVQTLYMGIRDDGTFYSYWYMPFLENARMVISYNGEGEIPLSLSVNVTELSIPKDEVLYFGAAFRVSEYANDSNRWPDTLFLKANGEGRFVGLTLHVSKFIDGKEPGLDSGAATWWGEGDEKIFVDGEKFPSWFGTGTEDFYGFAWCDITIFNKAFHSQNSVFGGRNNAGNRSMTRVFVTDSIPFTSSFEGYLEKYYSDKYAKYGYTAYFYLKGSFDQPSYEDTVLDYFVPNANAAPTNYTEGENLYVDAINSAAGKYTIQGMTTWGTDWSTDTQIFFTGFKTGESVDLVLPAESTGKYVLITSFTRAKDYGKVQCLVNGTEIGEPLDFYASAVSAQRLDVIGAVDLTEGFTNTLTLKVVGKNTIATNYYFGLDFIILVPADEFTSLSEFDLTKYNSVQRLGTKNASISSYRYEGEELVGSVKVSDGSVRAQAMTAFGTAWSGNNQLFWTKGKEGSTLDLTVFVGSEGEYDLTLALTSAGDYADLTVYVNGKKISDINCYSTKVSHMVKELGAVSLNEGNNKITLKISGKNTKATNYYVGLDYVTLDGTSN